MEFDEGGIGLIGNELSNQLFVGCQFQLAPTLSFLGGNSAGLSVLFDERIDGRAADRVLENEVFDDYPKSQLVDELGNHVSKR